MHIVIILFTLFATWRWGDWRNWRKYHSTMLFVSSGTFLYLYLYKNAMLWDLERHLLNHAFTEILYAVIVTPFTALLLLSNYPSDFGKQSLRILKFISIYSAVEFIYHKLGFIVYNYGWNLGLSVAWNLMMFPMLVLHYKKPLYAYAASIAGLVIFLILFPVKM